MTPRYDVMRMALHLCGSRPQSNREENQSEGHSACDLPADSPQNCQGHRNEGESEELSQPRGH